MELCGARLSQREALVFGVPGSKNSNVRRAMLKLRMLDRNELTTTNANAKNANANSISNADQDLTTQNSDFNNDDIHVVEQDVLEKTMLWTELEACKRQVNQIGVSACGATALINVLQVSLI